MTQAGLALPGLAGRRTIDQVMPSVAAALGNRGFANTLELPEAPRYVVLLVDGLGQTLLEAHATEAPFLSSLHGINDVVCGVPSTTATSLTSLGTGVAAGSHGMVGYTSRDPESGQRLNALRWDLPIDPVIWQPRPTVLEMLQADGVSASSVNDAKFVDTGLTLCSQRGVPFHGVNSVWERLDVIVEVIEAAPRSVTYAYESRLDHTGHAYGCGSEKWREMLTTVDQEIADLRAELPDDCVLIVTADHGMIDLPMENRFDVNQHPALLNDVTMLAGERGSATSTRTTAPRPTSRRDGPNSWAIARSYVPRTASRTGSGRSIRRYADVSAMSWLRRSATSRCSPPLTSRLR